MKNLKSVTQFFYRHAAHLVVAIALLITVKPASVFLFYQPKAPKCIK